MLSSSLSWVLFAAVASSSPAHFINNWVPAGPNDSRSPCPMLNTLANHGYLPHDGKNISVDQFGEATAMFNIHPNIGRDPAAMFSQITKKERFDLFDLNVPGILQHPASLSRLDWEKEDPHVKVNQKRVQDLLDDSKTDVITVESLALSRLRVEEISEPRQLSSAEEAAAQIEASLLLAIMIQGDIPAPEPKPRAKAYVAPKEPVRIFLQEERFPVEHGWTPPNRLLDVPTITPIQGYIADYMAKHRQDSADS